MQKLSPNERRIANVIAFPLALGTAWFVAWLANPNIDSGTVWLLAYIYASLDAGVVRLITKAGA
jgi:hypothetical protein